MSATKLATARTIGGVAFDGTANINLPGVNTTGNQSTTGNADTATKLATARTISGVSFDGTANITLTAADVGALALSGGTLTSGLGFIPAAAGTNPITIWNKPVASGANAQGIAGFDSTGVTRQWGVGLYSTNGSPTFAYVGFGTAPWDSGLQIRGLGDLRAGPTNRLYHEGYLPTPAVLGAVPQARTINTKPLTSDVVLSAADIGALPIAGGSLVGSVYIHPSAPQEAVTGLRAAPLMRPHVNVGVVSSFIPFGHMTAQSSAGYITHLNFGLYKRGVGTWDGSGMYMATGGSDGSPTEFFLLKYGGDISHSKGHTFYHTGFKPTA